MSGLTPTRICALHDRAVEETSAPWRNQVEADALGACRRSCESDVSRISAELGDVVAHPDECRPLIQEPVIAREGWAGSSAASALWARKPKGPRR